MQYNECTRLSCSSHGSATSNGGRDWAAGTVREAQRGFVENDPHAALVTAIDAEIGDYTVPVSKKGAKVIAERIAVASRGRADTHGGSRY